MSKHHDAADAIRKLAKQFEQMTMAASLLDSIGSIEQATAEAQKARDAANSERDKAKADLAKVKDQIAAAEATVAGKLAAAEEAVKAKVDAMIKGAEEAAALTIKKGQDEAARMVAQASTEKARLSSEIGGLQRAIEAAKADLSANKAARDEAEAAAKDAEKRLDAIKGKLKDLLA